MEWFNTLIGQGADNPNWWQMTTRGFLCFIFAVALIRGTGKRIFGKNTAIDIVISVIIGSNISRAITGNAPFVATLVTTTALLIFYLILIHIAQRFPRISEWLKGQETQLIRDGETISPAMKIRGVGPGDLEEAMRLQGHAPDIDAIQEAYMERNGTISIIIEK